MMKTKWLRRSLTFMVAVLMLAIGLTLSVSAETKTATGFNDGADGGIVYSTDHLYRYITLVFDGEITPSHNAQANDDEVATANRKYIAIDGRTVEDWIKFGGGDVYQVMVSYENPDPNDGTSVMPIWFAVDREPAMDISEIHTVELLEGLITPDGDAVTPQKYYYSPDTKQWRQVDTYDGLEMPWQPTTTTTTTVNSNVSTTVDQGTTTAPQDTSSASESTTSTNPPVSNNSEPEVGTETGMPVWGIVLIVVGVVVVAAVVVVVIVLKKRK